MGANAQTVVPVFTAGQVLTAAQVTQINTGIPVFATTTTRDAAFGGTGEKTLAQGQTCYIEATSSYQTYNGSSWVTFGTAPGLVLVKSQTIGSAVASVTVTDAFSSTYDTYKITVTGGVGSASAGFRLQLGSTTTGYYSISNQFYYSSGASEFSRQSNGANFQSFGDVKTTAISASAEIGAPNLAKFTTFNAPIMSASTDGIAGFSAGYLNDSTQYTAFTISPSSGTLTGGTIRVFGYANS
jgi:hypothetical protein